MHLKISLSLSLSLHTLPLLYRRSIIPIWWNALHCLRLCSSIFSLGVSPFVNPEVPAPSFTPNNSQLCFSCADVASFKHQKCRDITFCAIAVYRTTALKPITMSNEFTFIRHCPIYPFNDGAIADLITTFILSALDTPPKLCPYYRAYLLPACVCRIVYLNFDVVLVSEFALITNEKCVKFDNKKRKNAS